MVSSVVYYVEVLPAKMLVVKRSTCAELDRGGTHEVCWWSVSVKQCKSTVLVSTVTDTIASLLHYTLWAYLKTL